MNQNSKYQNNSTLINILIGTIGSIVATGILNVLGYFNIEVNIIIGLTLLSTILLIILWINWKNSLNNKSIGTDLGLDHVYTNNKPSLDDYVTDISTSFYFWGISAKRTTSNPKLQKKMIEIGHIKGEIKFLLLNPKSEVIGRKSEDENDDAVSWRNEISATIQRLKSFSKKHNINIEVRVYNEFPIWRMNIINEKRIYLNYFLSNQQGPESPLLEITPVTNGLFWGYLNEFKETWEHKSEKI